MRFICFSDLATPKVGYWVAAVYDDQWYVEKDLVFDNGDSEAFVLFMEPLWKSEATFKMPIQPDVIWISLQSILAIIQHPSPCGKTQRQYKINIETVEMISHPHAKSLASKASKTRNTSKK